jgi:hypothetical protein
MQIQHLFLAAISPLLFKKVLGTEARANHNLESVAWQPFTFKMAAINRQCNLHLCNSLPENEPLYTLTEKRYDTFIEYTRRWSTLCKYPEKTVALANSGYLELTFERAGEVYYHESCYKRYTDDVKLKRAKRAMVSVLNQFNNMGYTYTILQIIAKFCLKIVYLK